MSASLGQIGRYTIERSLARGGMAEVFLARAEGPGGFQKSVVIKRILPDLAEDGRFVEMFLNEARLAALLNHPNIVQVYDFGEEDSAYFIAMEYIQGESVRNALLHFRDAGRPFPVRAAAQIAVGVCEGLHYAHELCDQNGVSYNIIHRDVTPENILISSSGIPKIVDFGIAKASSNTNRTEAGTMKGKYAYMAPEQIRGHGADRRLDVYAVGVCLYELLAGRKPFDGEPLQLLHAILEGRIPPIAALNPAVPRELSDLVAISMAVDPERRFPDAHRMGDAIEDWLLATGKRVSAVELAHLVAEVAKERKGARRIDQTSGPKGVPGFPPEGVLSMGASPAGRRPSGAGQRASAEAADAVATVFEAVAIDGDHEDTPTDLGEGFGPTVESENRTRIRSSMAKAAVDDAPPEPIVRAPLGSRRLILALGSLGALAVLAVGWFALRRGAPPARAPLAAVVEERPSPAAPATAPAPAPPPAPAASPPPPVPPEATAVAPAPAPPTPAPAPPAQPDGAQTVAATSPPPRAAPIEGGRGGSTPSGPVQPRQGRGFLTVRSSPWCDVYLDGTKIGVTPISRYELPSGRHFLVLKNQKEGAYRETSVKVEPGREAKEALVFGQGTLDIRVQPWAQVFVDGKPLGMTPLKPLALLAGTHELRLVNHEIGKEETRRVAIREGGREVVKVFW